MENRNFLINFRGCIEHFGGTSHTKMYWFNAFLKAGWTNSYDLFYSMWLGYRKVTIEHAWYLSKVLNVGIDELIKYSNELRNEGDKELC